MKRINYQNISKNILKIDISKLNKLEQFVIYELQIFYLEIKLFFKNSALSRASDLAFSSLLSLVPILSVLFVIFKLFGGKDIVDSKVKPYIYEFVAPGVGKQISGYLDTFIDSATIETLGSIGFIFLIISVFLILSSIENTFNLIWHIKESRSITRKLKSYWLIVTISPILMILYLSLTSYLSLNLVIHNTLWEHFSSILFFQLFPFFLILGFFSLLIKVLPNCVVETKHALTGALIGTFLYYITKNVFIDYTKLAVSYNVIYGSIAALPMFMIWIYWFWIIILFSVQSTFVRQNFNNLKLRDNMNEVNYFDKIRIGFIVSMKMIKDYLNSKDPSNVSEYSSDLNIPSYLISECFMSLEKSGIVKMVNNKMDVYTPAIPIKDITVKKIVDSINKMYLNDMISIKLTDQENILKVVEEYKSFQSTTDDEPVENFFNTKT